MPVKEVDSLLETAAAMGLYDTDANQVSSFGKALVDRFRTRFNRARAKLPVGTNSDSYYPSQCEGKFRELGKAGRGNGRSAPMEPQ